MESHIALGAAHWVYLAGVLAIVLTMVFRANVVVPAIVATFLVTLAWTHSPVSALASIFNASFVAARELFNIFLVIALMTALLNSLKALRSDVRMVEPFRAVMKNGHAAYFMLAAITYTISLFFWPTPAIPLVSAILLPAAIAAGLPPLAGAMAIAIAGQGTALSSDYVIGVAPGISAKAAGAAVSAAMVADRALVLSLITGGIALTMAYFSIRAQIRPANAGHLARWQGRAPDAGLAGAETAGSFDKSVLARGTAHDEPLGTDANIARSLSMVELRQIKWSKVFAVLTPLAFAAVIALMVVPRLGLGVAELKGGEAAAMVGGMAALLMILCTLAAEGPRKMLDVSAEHITDGFVFAFKAMGSVLPIAGFFFIGAGDTAGAILHIGPGHAPSLLFELIQGAGQWIPNNHVMVAFGVLLVGMITGIDGSGFAGLPLTGTLAGALGPTVGIDAATLCAVGQMGAVWTGGGTLIAWSSLVAITGFARVPVLDAVRALLLPVLAGLAVSTMCAVVLWR
ncbi:membrane protein [Burkholderiaceae bacterium 16]|nr:membrane protein [Burkholderiaceae bacterium 16]